MKKLLYLFGLIICFFCLCGCESNQTDRKEIFEALKKEKIISDSMEEIDVVTHGVWDFEWCRKNTYHIYKDKDSKMVAIQYESKKNSDAYDYDHLVTIFYDVKYNNSEIEFINREDFCDTDDGGYTYQNGDYTRNNKYIFGPQKEYKATLKDAWFFKKYSFEEN